jgi:quercetin dioxygenase-like cupin family protein
MRTRLAIIVALALVSTTVWAQATRSARSSGPAGRATTSKAPHPDLKAKHHLSSAEQAKFMPLPDIFPPGATMTVMEGDPAKEPAVFYFRFPAGYRIPMHFHSAAERLYMNTGSMQFRMFGGETSTVDAGTYVHFPARMPHEAVCQGSQECALFLHSEGPFDVHLIDENGKVVRSWSAKQAAAKPKAAAREGAQPSMQ